MLYYFKVLYLLFLAGRDISQDSVVYWISAFHLGCVHAKVNIPADDKLLQTWSQHVKKVVSDSLGLVDFAIGLVNSVFNLPDGQVQFLRNSRIIEELWNQSAHQTFLRLVEMMFGLLSVSCSLSEWEAVKVTFFAPWISKLMSWKDPLELW